MRIVCVSDTHELHREVDVPGGDLLIHAGDFLHQQNQRPKSSLRDFNDWLGSLPHRYKIIVAGNHDWVLEDPANRSILSNATMLIDSGVEIEGIRIWGSPVTPLYGGAFGISRAEDRRKHWALIPRETEILVTHGPAFGILDTTENPEEHEGDSELLEAIVRIKPVLHVFGHSHRGYGQQWMNNTLHVNAAMSNELGGVERTPIVIPTFESRVRGRRR